MSKIYLDNSVPEKENEVLTRTQLKSIMGGTVSSLARFENPCKTESCSVTYFNDYGQVVEGESGQCAMKRVASTVTCYCAVSGGTGTGSILNSSGASHCWKGN